MKTLNKLFSITAMALLLVLMAPHKSMAQDDGYVSDQEFYDNLQDYGTWVQDDQYGDVWVPDVDGDFRPYATNGYWVQTDYGTTWVSDYPWGWATFHYGRWRYDDYYGWEWIPGHEWAPAWVSWRQGGGYYGWAPMGPGLSITLSLGGIGINIADNYWVYTPQRYITSRYVSRYYTPHTRIVNIIRKTTYIHNTYVYNKRTYITGPRPRDIQKITRQKVTVYKINNAARPGAFHTDKTTINIYRPVVKKSTDARPVRVVSATAYKNEHPTAGIGKKGTPGYNRGNAAKLASIARSDNPNSKVVKVNPRKSDPNKPNEGNKPGELNKRPEGNKPGKPAKNNEPNKPNEGNKPGEPNKRPEDNKPGRPDKANEPNKTNEGINPAQPAKANGGKGHHKTAPATAQPASQAPAQPADNKPAEPQGNAPAAPVAGHHRKTVPAVMPAEQHSTDQTQQQQQAKTEAQQQRQQAKQEAQQQQKLQQQQAQEAKQQQQQAQQAERQQQAQQARQAAQQAKQQQQDQARQAAQQAKQQQQQAQQAERQQQQEQARQAAQQAKQQQQQAARQAAQQAKQQQQQAAREAAQQARQQALQKQKEEQQKQQQQSGGN